MGISEIHLYDHIKPVVFTLLVHNMLLVVEKADFHIWVNDGGDSGGDDVDNHHDNSSKVRAAWQ